MLEGVSKKNELFDYLAENKLLRAVASFKKVTANEISDFPVLNHEELQDLFTGTYQLRLAASYLADLILQSDSIDSIEYLLSGNLLKARMPSRHSKSKRYNTFIRYETWQNSVDGIKDKYCSCANGMRTVGFCCHSAAIIFHLSFAKYQEKVVTPAAFLSKVFVEDEPVVLNEDSEEE